MGAETKSATKRSGKAKTAKNTPDIPAKLVKQLEQRIQHSMLPGDDAFPANEIRDAAEFLLETGSQRSFGKTAIALGTATDERRFMRIAIINDDMPFIVDSVAAIIAAHGLSIDRLVHPIVPVTRDKDGTLEAIPAGEPDEAMYESMVYIETSRVDARTRRALTKALRETLEDVRAAVNDWPKLQTAMKRDAKRLGEHPDAALLDWLNKGMLTQLGHVVQTRAGEQKSAIGICRKSTKEILAESSIKSAFAWFDEDDADDRQLLIIKANHLSSVHRRVPLDLFIVPVRGEKDKIEALSIHAGVWTSAALAAPPRSVPRLAEQIETIMADLDFDTGSHAGKALVHALTALPHDVLIGFSKDDVARIATTMMSLVDRPRPRLALVTAPLSRHLFAFVWIPRDMLATQVRLRIQSLIEEGCEAPMLDYSLEVEGGNLAMLRFVLDFREGTKKVSEAELEERLQIMLRGWGEAVETELAKTQEPGRAAAIAGRYAESFPNSYRGENGPAEAARDIVRLRSLHPAETHAEPQDRREPADYGNPDHAPAPVTRDARLYRRADTDDTDLRLKLYQTTGSLPLSDAVPALENFGFTVCTEVPTHLDNGNLGTIHDFTLSLPETVDPEAVYQRAEPIAQAIAAVLNNQEENDPFNRLVTETGLGASEATWLRSFYRYLRQAGITFTIYTVVDALRGAPKVTAGLVALFTARHDPAFKGSRDEAISQAEEDIRSGLTKVSAINDDRLLRLYKALVDAILRTNAFSPAADEALAFKIDSALVPNLPKPLPWREIWVYSRRVEGIHLRAGPIARGGLRWSDRRDDFRTEVLGLMKAQRVKNAVIVPTGAKGGFYPKQLPSPARDRDAWAAEGQASYEVFIRTLLSVTDNIVDDKVVHPQDVRILDGEDPYFVVAADKGTARFSDVANAIAESEDFWLDDAFASGGSNGYDHKAMGITARGAWISVQRHFREMGIDVQEESVTVAGCGDMSGDVFGNGMLLSKALKLVAAFDHRHIFIDPDPDPAKSWKERQRLFDLPRSSWDDYNKDLISRGGGVYPRNVKTITMSKTAQKMLGIETDAIEPDKLISAILAAPVDLFWFGGIGTYMKSASQNNIEVGDPANDSLRINAGEMRAKVIGEGANLGVTQAGRIEYALKGGRLNTDFIDNSAGVDCSDNEVNIKIALAAARRAGKLSEEKRNALLKEMTDEVADIVLQDNEAQALALSIAKIGGEAAVESQWHLIETLEMMDALDRSTEGLADRETYMRRAGDGEGLTRPELAVLLSSTKLVLQDAIETSGMVDDAALEPTLIQAFPAPMQDKYRKQILNHRLRKELIATKIANRMINRLGIVHPFELAEEEGDTLQHVASAFVVAEELFDLDALWEAIEHGKMPEDARLLMLDRLARSIRIQMADLLRVGDAKAAPSTMIEQLRPGVSRLTEGTGELLGTESRVLCERLQGELVEAGAPDKLAGQVAHLFALDGSVGLASLARDAGIDVAEITRGFTTLGGKLGLDWAQSTAALMNPSDVWERLLVAGLAQDFQQIRLEFLRRISRRKGAKDDIVQAVENWLADNAQAVEQYREMIARAQSQTPYAPAMLAQLASMGRNVLGR